MGAISCWIESSVIKCEGHGGQRKRNIDEARNQYAQFHWLSSSGIRSTVVKSISWVFANVFCVPANPSTELAIKFTRWWMDYSEHSQ